MYIYQAPWNALISAADYIEAMWPVRCIVWYYFVAQFYRYCQVAADTMGL